jgi:hypothetical protein
MAVDDEGQLGPTRETSALSTHHQMLIRTNAGNQLIAGSFGAVYVSDGGEFVVYNTANGQMSTKRLATMLAAAFMR